MKVGEAIVALLEQYGVRHVFGIPGTHSIELYRGLATSSITHILPRHEQGAGFMADGYARLSGEPGVCFVITGPGITNISTAMAQAWSDSVPMLVISPINDLVNDEEAGEARYQGRLHELTDQSQVTAPFTRWSNVAASADEVADLIHQAFAGFHQQRPQPVHIHVPLSLLISDVESPWSRRIIESRALPDAAIEQDVVKSIENAKRPVIVAGGGCRHFSELVISLAEKIPAPVVTSIAGRGVIQGTHPLCSGSQPASASSQRLIAESDLLIAIGSELSETDFWGTPRLPAQQIWINIDEAVPFSEVSSSAESMTIVTDARQFMPAVSARLAAPERPAIVAAHQRARVARDGQLDNLSPLERKHWRVLTELMKRLPAQAVVASDMTQLAYTAGSYLPLQQPNSWFHPNGYGTLGYALPAAIGIALSRDDTPALAIVGDAGFQYTLAELSVAVERDLPLVVLLWNNDALQQIAHDMDNAGIELNAVSQRNPDFAKLVDAMGAAYQRVRGISALGPALQSAFEAKRVTVLELHESDI